MIDLRNCDYKELLPQIEENSIDLLLTDPPYCVSRDYQLGFSNMGRAGMNYGDWDYDFNQTEWIDLASSKIKPGGSIIIFNDWKNMSYLVSSLEKNGFIIKDLLRWKKSNPMPRNTTRRYVSDAEYAIWAVKPGKPWIFNKPADISYYRPEFEAGLVLGKSRIHPTQKPVNIIEQLITIHSNENDLICDLFSGSGVVGLVCKKLNRNFIGSELNKEYFDKAVLTYVD